MCETEKRRRRQRSHSVGTSQNEWWAKWQPFSKWLPNNKNWGVEFLLKLSLSSLRIPKSAFVPRSFPCRQFCRRCKWTYVASCACFSCRRLAFASKKKSRIKSNFSSWARVASRGRAPRPVSSSPLKSGEWLARAPRRRAQRRGANDEPPAWRCERHSRFSPS